MGGRYKNLDVVKSSHATIQSAVDPRKVLARLHLRASAALEQAPPPLLPLPRPATTAPHLTRPAVGYTQT